MRKRPSDGYPRYRNLFYRRRRPSRPGKYNLVYAEFRGDPFTLNMFSDFISNTSHHRPSTLASILFGPPRLSGRGLSVWLAQLLGRTHQNVVVVALANKLVRMAWVVLCKNERYRAPVFAVTT
jgi:hypothetical protein